jgi:hypothetical protein
MNGRMIKQEITSESKRIAGIARRQQIELTPYIYIYIGNSIARRRLPDFIIFSGNSSSAKPAMPSSDTK